MIKKAKITSLSELKKRKKQIRLEAEVANREFAHSIGTTKGNAGNFLFKNVALPAGGALVGIMFLSSLLSSKDKGKMPVIKETRVIHEYADGTPYTGKPRKKSRTRHLSTIIGMSKLIIPIIQAVMATMTSKEAKHAADVAKRAAVRK